MSAPAGSRECKACGKRKPASCYEVVSTPSRNPYTRGKCRTCFAIQKAAYDRTRIRVPRRVKFRKRDQAEYKRHHNSTLIGRLVRQKAKARERQRHWAAVEDDIDAQLVRLRARYDRGVNYERGCKAI